MKKVSWLSKIPLIFKFLLSVFCEGPEEGEFVGPLSMRRVLAAASFILSYKLAVMGLEKYQSGLSDTLWGEIGFYAPFIFFLLSSLILLFFTTLTDIKSIVSAFKDFKSVGRSANEFESSSEVSSGDGK